MKKYTKHTNLDCQCCCCRAKRGEYKGKEHPNYIDGRTNKKYYCIEPNCNNEISYQNTLYGSRKCRSCSKKDSLSPTYIDGRTNKRHYCKEENCNNEISYGNWLSGNKRCQSCAHKGKNNNNFGNHKLVGKNNPMYNKHHTKKTKRKISLSNGGTGVPYENNNYPPKFFRIRPKILKRDNYKCQKCNLLGDEVHHIDYDKQNCNNNNLITLCHKCNMKANKNKDYWYTYFNYLLLKENK